MNVDVLLAELRSAGVTAAPLPNGNVRLRPKSRVTPELASKVRAVKPALLAALAGQPAPVDNAPVYNSVHNPPAQPPELADLVAALLMDFADAIASYPRSPVLSDLALARVSDALVSGARAMRDAPGPELGRRIAVVMRARCGRACEFIRTGGYASADVELTAMARELAMLRGH